MPMPLTIEPFVTAGVDVGARAVKLSLVAHDRGRVRVLASEVTRVEGRRDIRDARAAVRDVWARTLSVAGLSSTDVALVASTGTSDQAFLRAGHFYRRLSHLLGARLLFPDAAVVLDIGAFQTRCVVAGADLDIRRYRVTNRNASCGGESLDRISQRLGVTLDEAGHLPALWPLQEALAARAIAILRTARVKGQVVLVGGTVRNAAFLSTLNARLAESSLRVELLVSRDGIFAGAYGAALLAARRYQRLTQRLLSRRVKLQLDVAAIKPTVLN